MRPFLALALIALPFAASAQELNEAGLPYFAPGSGVTDYEALRRRELAVIDAQFGAFAQAAHAMQDAAQAHCDSGADFLPAYSAARLAWAPLEAYQFGPMEQNGAALSVNFWPDTKGFVKRALPGLLGSDQDLRDPAVISQHSAAVQGFPALEALIAAGDDTTCPAIIGISAHVAQLGDELYEGWFGTDGWAELALSAGPDNPVYLNAREFTKEIYTAYDFLLERMKDQSLKRPLGDATGPKPHRAEAWQTDLSLPIIDAQLDAIAQMLRDGYAGDTREPNRAWVLDVVDQTKARLESIDAPLTQAVADPDGIWKIDGLRNKIAYLKLQMDQDIGPNLGVETGFSPADGD